MITPKVQVVYDYKGLSHKMPNKPIQVYIRVTFQRRVKYFPTGTYITSKQWLESSKTVINARDSVQLNERIMLAVRNVQDYITTTMKKGEVFTFDGLASFLNKADLKDSFIEYMQNSIDKRMDIVPSTKQIHISALKALRNYGKIQSFADLSISRIESFDTWLHSTGLQQSSITCYHVVISSYITRAVRNEMVESNPYDKYTFSRSRNEQRKYISEADIEVMRTATFKTKTLNVSRDLFIFQVFTGLAYADLAKFDFTKVRKHNGRFVLHDVRQKSKEDYYIVLLSPAMEILRRYNFKLPILHYHRYRYSIQRISILLGLPTKLTTHMARHTFAVYAINHNVPIESLAKMMGHTNINTTQIYAKIANTTVERAFDILEQSIKNPTFLNAGSEINNSD